MYTPSMGPSIYKVASIGEGVLSVMAKPVSGEWVRDEFSSIASAGVMQVVSLLEVAEAYELGLDQEEALCKEQSMSFVSYPIPDRGLPRSPREFAAFCTKLHRDIRSGTSCVVHCRAGIGRTGLVAAGILLREGFDPIHAFDTVSKARGVLVPDTDEQRDWLIENFREISR